MKFHLVFEGLDLYLEDESFIEWVKKCIKNNSIKNFKIVEDEIL